MNRLVSRNNGIDSLVFPDSQPYITIDTALSGQTFDVRWPIRNPTELLELALIRSAADGIGSDIDILTIPYLMGARSDRRMEHGGSIPLKVIAGIINDVQATQVNLLDVHSDVALTLIDRSASASNALLISEYHDKNSVLIIPDAGAQKKADAYTRWNYNLTDTISCIKHRDPSDGKIKLQVIKPEICKGRNCVIVDDLCDGGATFLAIAEQISPKKLTLIVTHGVFSKGFEKLFEKFDTIITTDSFTHLKASEEHFKPRLVYIPTTELL